ncbi:acyl-CoA thioesterase [Stenotrophobium rhamnosiphilum]|uniref:Acyl-CoA thioesterase n=1 Tax=Stenotrophobium rhamnosiphilum TaxID=2029166 RepID=A0A2T5MG37_9GAMM|nr:acyl-CoA thioesterase [Stenotrophobium rhamnosiphilum]PTU31545.1 acyl-CoA thioesterase [Stenotrophobium rhamnosiphilum]
MTDNVLTTPRPVALSAVREQVYMVFPNDLNANDTVFGGLIMAHMDRYAAVVADRHSGGVTVTASVDAVHFVAPARRGDVLIFNASINRAWNSSMEVGVKVDAQSYDGCNRRHILSAYLTFVALDAAGKPRPVPPIKAETPDELRRYQEAQLRREQRLRHAEEIKQLRSNFNTAV